MHNNKYEHRMHREPHRYLGNYSIEGKPVMAARAPGRRAAAPPRLKESRLGREQKTRSFRIRAYGRSDA
jgi:hypothetical protein